ncbi:MAG: glycoside hydrolase family 32 protein [Bacteroidetes bacterium]|nr:MAG: glycoside hydrolase family 32 protein [Bacteroidota bacterium]
MKIRYLLALSLLALACQPQPQTDTAAATPTYDEPWRPQVHYSPPSQWMNDPNGMVYHEGEYHLFYQHYPDSNVWGPMHWGHAVSTDLVHWEQLPIALYPDSLGYIFSGSAVVDAHNTSGLAPTGQVPMVAIFTYHEPVGAEAGRLDHQTQGIAYSLDRGRSWTKYEGNPVLPNPGIRDFRDPKVFWHAESEHWVMILAVADRIHLYRSPNLLDWTFASEFGAEYGAHGGVWECPDLFPLTLDGQEWWVLLLSINPGGPNGGSATQYFVGDFDGQTFTSHYPAGQTLWIDEGKDNYAGVTWSGIPAADGRRLFLGWMSNWQYANVVPTTAWRSAMTLPRRLDLWAGPDGPRLANRPVREVAQLEGNPKALPVGGLESIPSAPISAPMVLRVQIIPGAERRCGLTFANGQGERLGIDYRGDSLYVDRSEAGRAGFSADFAGRHGAPLGAVDTLTLDIYLDVASVEVFAQGGRLALTEIVFPEQPYEQLQFHGAGTLVSAKCAPLERIWP